MSKLKKLESALDQASLDFASELHQYFHEGSKEPVTEEDLMILGQQVQIALDRYREEIIKYLSE